MNYTDKRLEEVLKIAVNRFLGWKLPADFSPDGGISFKSGVCETIGTHLFTAQQANEMLKYVLEEALSTSIQQALAEDRERVVEEIEKWTPKKEAGFYAGVVKGMTLDDHKRNFSKDIIKAISSLKEK